MAIMMRNHCCSQPESKSKISKKSLEKKLSRLLDVDRPWHELGTRIKKIACTSGNVLHFHVRPCASRNDFGGGFATNER